MELNGHPARPDALKALALSNYGHFTSMRVDDGRVRGLGLHLERLDRDCRAVFGTGLDADRVRDLIRRGVHGHDGAGAFVVRVTVFDPRLDIGHPSRAAAPSVLVTTRSAAPQPLQPIEVKSVPYVRDAPQVKHLGLFGACHARRAAQLAGYDDALFVGPDGLVSEGGTWNVGFIEADGSVVWPEADVLPGVTMRLLRQQYEHTVRPVALGEVHGMRAAFATNTAIGVRAVSAVDGVQLDVEQPVLAALRDAFLSVSGDEV